MTKAQPTQEEEESNKNANKKMTLAQPAQEEEYSSEDPEESLLLPLYHREATPPPRQTTVNLQQKLQPMSR